MPSTALNDALASFAVATGDSSEPMAREARATVATLLERIAELEREAAEAAATLSRFAELERRLADAEQLVAGERETELELNNLRARNEELLGILDSVYRSTSWKVTEPMRRAVDLARSTAVDTLRQWRRH